LLNEAIAFGKLLHEQGKNVQILDIAEVMHHWDKDGNVGIEDDVKRAVVYGKAVEVLRSVYRGEGLQWRSSHELL
jgi:hypothetical protein